MTKAAITPQDLSWPFWPIVPLYPYGQRRTIRQEVVKDTLWTFEQLQGIFYVVVPIRMTVIKLASGGLFVYAPVAPTPECIRLMRELEGEHGEVKYIILPVPGQPWASVWVRVCKWSKNSKKKEIEKWAS